MLLLLLLPSVLSCAGGFCLKGINQVVDVVSVMPPLCTLPVAPPLTTAAAAAAAICDVMCRQLLPHRAPVGGCL
jgi:hypothetical protein